MRSFRSSAWKAWVGAAAFLGGALSGAPARAQTCVPKCRTGYVCAAGNCVSACNPPCGAGQVCTPQGECASACNPACAAGEVCSPAGQCVSACNPACPAGEVCSPAGQCVSACNPPCPQGEQCTASAQCVAASAPAAAPAAPAPTPAPPVAPMAPAPQPAPESGSAGGGRGHPGFLQAGALIGRFSYSGTWPGGASIEGSGLIFGVEAAGGLQVSAKFRVGAGLQFFSMPSPSGTKDGTSESPDTGKGGVVGGYLAWGGDGGLLIDGIAGYGGSGTEGAFGGWGPGLFPGIGYQSSGPVRFSIVGRFYVMPTSASSGESGTFTGFQAVASVGSF